MHQTDRWTNNFGAPERQEPITPRQVWGEVAVPLARVHHTTPPLKHSNKERAGVVVVGWPKGRSTVEGASDS